VRERLRLSSPAPGACLSLPPTPEAGGLGVTSRLVTELLPCPSASTPCLSRGAPRCPASGALRSCPRCPAAAAPVCHRGLSDFVRLTNPCCAPAACRLYTKEYTTFAFSGFIRKKVRLCSVPDSSPRGCGSRSAVVCALAGRLGRSTGGPGADKRAVVMIMKFR
jgi:hypothetical protein